MTAQNFIARLVLLASIACSSAIAAERVPGADFFRPAEVTRPVMSPSGEYAAATMAGGEGGRQRLVILDLKDIAKSKVVAGFSDADIVHVRWVNNDRLVFTLADRQSPVGDQDGEGLYAVDREGTQSPRRLIKRRFEVVTEATHIVDRELSAYHQLFAVLRDGSNDVVVRQYVFDTQGEFVETKLWRVDTTTTRTRILSADAPAFARRWALDPRGEPRAVLTAHAGKSRLYWKPNADAPWTQVLEGNTWGQDALWLEPLAVGANDVLYGEALVGDDSGAVMREDMHQAKLDKQPLMSFKGYDFDGELVFGPKGDLLGVHYLTDAQSTHWFDPALKKIQAQVDALLPGTTNRIDCGSCEQPSKVLVSSWSDRQPAVYRLYDLKTDKLDVLASSRPWIKAAAMARRDMLRFAARDGLEIPVNITRPVGQKGPAPAVVLVHGGPWARSAAWSWDGTSQFLASRGYVVIEPEFRGSTGFGFKHHRAGWKQWGLSMQDDVADATQWAIKQGYADPQRICIAGGSYGGYATLMGLARYADLYQCGFEWVGVTDIDLIYSIHWSDTSDMWKDYGMPVLVGDRKADAKQLEATSPLKLGGRITKPLLMAYGGVDVRVPIDHGIKFRDAVREHNKDVEWIVYPDEGHTWMLPANEADFWTHVERFLDKHLKAAP